MLLIAAAVIGASQHLALRDRQIPEHGEMGKQVELLKDHPDLGAEGVAVRIRLGDVLPLDEYRAGGGLLEPVDAPQQRRLARPGRADDADHVTDGDLEVDAAQHVEVSKRLVQIDDPDGRAVDHFDRAALASSRRTRYVSGSVMMR